MISAAVSRITFKVSVSTETRRRKRGRAFCEFFSLFSDSHLNVIQRNRHLHLSTLSLGTKVSLLHKMRSSRADGPSLERLFLSAGPLLPHHFLRFHSVEQPHRAITPSALCRLMISFPFLPNKNNVTGTAGIYRGRIPASRHDIRVVSARVGTRREGE